MLRCHCAMLQPCTPPATNACTCCKAACRGVQAWALKVGECAQRCVIPSCACCHAPPAPDQASGWPCAAVCCCAAAGPQHLRATSTLLESFGPGKHHAASVQPPPAALAHGRCLASWQWQWDGSARVQAASGKVCLTACCSARVLCRHNTAQWRGPVAPSCWPWCADAHPRAARGVRPLPARRRHAARAPRSPCKACHTQPRHCPNQPPRACRRCCSSWRACSWTKAAGSCSTRPRQARSSSTAAHQQQGASGTTRAPRAAPASPQRSCGCGRPCLMQPWPCTCARWTPTCGARTLRHGGASLRAHRPASWWLPGARGWWPAWSCSSRRVCTCSASALVHTRARAASQPMPAPARAGAAGAAGVHAASGGGVPGAWRAGRCHAGRPGQPLSPS